MSYSSIWNHSTRHHILLMNSVCPNKSKRQIDAGSKPTRLANSRSSATAVTMTSEIDPSPPPWPWVCKQRRRGGESVKRVCHRGCSKTNQVLQCKMSTSMWLTPSHHDTIYPVLYCCSPGDLSSPCPSYKFKLKLKLLLISDPWSIYDFFLSCFFFFVLFWVFFSFFFVFFCFVFFKFLNIIVTNILLYVIVVINMLNTVHIIPATLQRIKRRTYNVQIMDGWMDCAHYKIFQPSVEKNVYFLINGYLICFQKVKLNR